MTSGAFGAVLRSASRAVSAWPKRHASRRPSTFLLAAMMSEAPAALAPDGEPRSAAAAIRTTATLRASGPSPSPSLRKRGEGKRPVAPFCSPLPLPLAGEGWGEGKPLSGDVRAGEGWGEGKPLSAHVRTDVIARAPRN